MGIPYKRENIYILQRFAKPDSMVASGLSVVAIDSYQKGVETRSYVRFFGGNIIRDLHLKEYGSVFRQIMGHEPVSKAQAYTVPDSFGVGGGFKLFGPGYMAILFSKEIHDMTSEPLELGSVVLIERRVRVAGSFMIRLETAAVFDHSEGDFQTREYKIFNQHGAWVIGPELEPRELRFVARLDLIVDFETLMQDAARYCDTSA